MTIYMIQLAGDKNAPIKIGYTNGDPRKRLQAAQTYHWAPLRLLATFPGWLHDERALHLRLAQHRLRGEWFAAHPDVLAVVDNPPMPTSAAPAPIPDGTGYLESLGPLPPAETVPDLVLRRLVPRGMIRLLPDMPIVVRRRRRFRAKPSALADARARQRGVGMIGDGAVSASISIGTALPPTSS